MHSRFAPTSGTFFCILELWSGLNPEHQIQSIPIPRAGMAPSLHRKPSSGSSQEVVVWSSAFSGAEKPVAQAGLGMSGVSGLGMAPVTHRAKWTYTQPQPSQLPPCGRCRIPSKGVLMNRIITRLALTAAAIVAGAGIVANAQTATPGATSAVVCTLEVIWG